VTNRYDVNKTKKPISIKLVVRNGGVVNSQTRPGTVIGVQGGIEVYNQTLAVSDPVGDGRSTFEFPGFAPRVAGDISWTATIADDDLDDDRATAATKVK
jgi:hypothetical protein